MSVNPVTAGSTPADLAAVIAHELAALAGDAKTLQSQLNTGDVVAAVVLPSNGLTDLLAIGGLRVAAELPPALVPGQTIMVQVTGFADDRINLQILPDAVPPAPATPPVPGAPLPNGGSANVPLSNGPTATGVVASAIAFDTPASGGPPQAMPLANDPPLLPGTSQAGARGPRSTPPVIVRQTAASGGVPPGPARSVRIPPEGLENIEARLATARATIARTQLPAAAPPARAVHTTGPPVRPPVVAPAALGMRPAIAVRSPVTAPATPASIAPRGLAAYAQPAALVRALALPVTPSNLAAARLALESPQRLPAALDALERALSTATDPHLSTLRTIVGFIGRIEPQSPVLATQVAAFVDHAVAGREVKLNRLLDAHADAAAAQASDAGDESAGADGTPGSAATPGTPAAAGPSTELEVFRRAEFDLDLKTQLLALATDAQASGPAKGSLLAAATAALTAVTASQITAASTLAAHPDGLAFALPVALPGGFANAHVRIDRDAPAAKGVPLDGDNFHIGFILETQHLGLVAIDVLTVGRSVTLSVKTEAESAQRVFGAAIAGLKARLETLRYRVTRAEAAVAPRGSVAVPSAPAVPESPAVAARDDTHLLDLDA